MQISWLLKTFLKTLFKANYADKEDKMTMFSGSLRED